MSDLQQHQYQPVLAQSKDSNDVCGSCGTPISTPTCVVLITECYSFHKHSQSPLTMPRQANIDAVASRTFCAIFYNPKSAIYFKDQYLYVKGKKLLTLFFLLLCYRKDEFMIECGCLGTLSRIRIGHDNKGGSAGWFLDKVC